ncbi:hypothetical protein ACFO4O_07575 [Glaciecola siphonariae]|uniref:Phage shock protein B n=1 Tax=Glaciecola siphonariae TaxID=521012 RepID=A0ABV9LX34_9ALTE
MNLTAIIIIAIICSMIVSIVNTVKSGNESKKRTKNLIDEHDQAVNEKLSAMQQRIEVLEKIVTDDKYTLNKEFSNLRD